MENKAQNILLTGYANLCRFVLAAIFVFSGFVKANDPLGFQYKLEDYVMAFGLSNWVPDFSLMAFTMTLSALEFLLGIYMLFGINRRLTSFVLLLMMLVMTPLTFYLALENPVSDCGCFGDAIILTNWQTFWKNVILLIAVISVLLLRNRIFRLVTRGSEWMVSFNSLLYVLILSYYSMVHLPTIDFRPYHVGMNIPEGMEIPEDALSPEYETFFVMEKDGEIKEFALDDYPDTTWRYVDRKTVLKREGYVPPIHDFTLMRVEDGEDITEQILNDEGYTFLMIAYDLQQADDGYTDLVNEVYDYCRSYGYTFYGLTASNEEMIMDWLDRTGGEYPFCQVDDITLKTMVRSNPGLMLLKGGVVVNKWAACDIPDEYQLKAPLEQLALAQEYNTHNGVERKVLLCLLWFMCPLIIVFMLDRIYYLCTRKHLGRDIIQTENINPLTSKEEK